MKRYWQGSCGTILSLMPGLLEQVDFKIFTEDSLFSSKRTEDEKVQTNDTVIMNDNEKARSAVIKCRNDLTDHSDNSLYHFLARQLTPSKEQSSTWMFIIWQASFAWHWRANLFRITLGHVHVTCTALDYVWNCIQM
ncbi:unnamed protein product, partial [Nesidiocoris tenuis]